MTVQDSTDAKILRQAETAPNEAFVDVEMRIADEQDARAIAFRLLTNLAETVSAGSGVLNHQMVGDDLDGIFRDIREVWFDVTKTAADSTAS